MKSRVDEEIAWYDHKSGANQRGFKSMRLVEILAAAAIPILSTYSYSSVRLTVAILGGAIAVIAAIMGLYQFQENWTNFRATCEALRHEKYLFMTHTEPYHIDDSFPLFVQRIESLISSEQSTWSQYRRGGKQEKET
jgi:hypothetical protein